MIKLILFIAIISMSTGLCAQIRLDNSYINRYPVHNEMIDPFLNNDESKIISMADYDSQILIRDAKTKKIIDHIFFPNIYKILPTYDKNKFLISKEYDVFDYYYYHSMIYDIEQRKVTQDLGYDIINTTTSLFPDEPYCATIDNYEYDGEDRDSTGFAHIHVWNYEDKELIKSIKTNMGYTKYRFSSHIVGEKLFIFDSDTGKMLIYNANDLSEIKTIDLYGEGTGELKYKFTDDGKYVFVYSINYLPHPALLIDIENSKIIKEWNYNSGNHYYGFDFYENDKYLIINTIHEDENWPTMQIYEAKTGELIKKTDPDRYWQFEKILDLQNDEVYFEGQGVSGIIEDIMTVENTGEILKNTFTLPLNSVEYMKYIDRENMIVIEDSDEYEYIRNVNLSSLYPKMNAMVRFPAAKISEHEFGYTTCAQKDKYFAIPGKDSIDAATNSVYIFEISPDTIEVKTIFNTGSDSKISYIDFSRDAGSLLVSDLSGRIKLFDIREQKEINNYYIGGQILFSFFKNDQAIILGKTSNHVNENDPNIPVELFEFDLLSESMTDLNFQINIANDKNLLRPSQKIHLSLDKKHLSHIDGNGAVSIVDMENFNTIFTANFGMETPPLYVDFIEGADIITISGGNNKIEIWNYETEELLYSDFTELITDIYPDDGDNIYHMFDIIGSTFYKNKLALGFRSGIIQTYDTDLINSVHDFKTDPGSLFSIYPNPVADQLNLINESAEMISNIELINLAGMKVREYVINENKKNITLPVSDVTDGFYLLKIHYGFNEYSTLNVIVQK